VNKVYVGNLAWGATEEDIETAFGAFGTITEAKIIRDRETGRSKGFAFVTYEKDTQANAAVDGMFGKELLGRPLKTSIAEERQRQPRQQREQRGGGYRQSNRGYSDYER
jgi:RNA recognition motif-containing protein